MTTSSDNPSHPTAAAQPDESPPGAGFAVKRIYLPHRPPTTDTGCSWTGSGRAG